MSDTQEWMKERISECRIGIFEGISGSVNGWMTEYTERNTKKWEKMNQVMSQRRHRWLTGPELGHRSPRSRDFSVKTADFEVLGWQIDYNLANSVFALSSPILKIKPVLWGVPRTPNRCSFMRAKNWGLRIWAGPWGGHSPASVPRPHLNTTWFTRYSQLFLKNILLH